MTCVSMGNPHAVLYCEHVAGVPLEWSGPHFERQPIFPRRINVHFVQVQSPHEVTHAHLGARQRDHAGLRHRGLRGVRRRRPDRPHRSPVLAHLPGGDLELDWAADNHVYMSGPAAEVFSGRVGAVKLESPLLNQVGGLLASSAVRWWMGTLDYKVAYYDRAIDPVFAECRGQKSTSSGTSTSCSRCSLRGHCNLAMLLSRHRDAEILSHIAGHLGFAFVRGSTNRGGVSALRQLLARSREMHLTITPDGPRGPRAGWPRAAFTWRRNWACRWWRWATATIARASQRWDRFAVPRPHCRARAIPSGEIFVPPDLDRDGLEHFRAKIEALLNRLTTEAETWAASGARRPGQENLRRRRTGGEAIGD